MRERRFLSLLLGAGMVGACSGSDHTELESTLEEPSADTPIGPSSSSLHSSFAARDVSPCGDMEVSAAGETSLLRVPYVQSVTMGSAKVLFKLQQAEDSWIKLSSPNGSSRLWRTQIDPAAPDGLQRAAHIEGLEPGTDYCYSLLGMTEPTHFRTAPAPDTNALVRFAVFGDSGTGDDHQRAVRDQLRSVPLDLMLHTGDVAYHSGTLEQIERNYFDVYAELIGSVPMFPVAGNHDYETDDAAPFREVFDLPDGGSPSGGERWYSFDWGDVHFVALDTQQIYEEQITWLDRDLAQNQRSWVVVYMHRPPFSSGKHGGSAAVLESFVPLFERHHVPLVFAGHEHDYERTIPIAGVTYVVTGGGGRYLRGVGSSWFTAHSQSVFHFVYVEVERGELHVHAIDSQGVEIDSVSLSR